MRPAARRISISTAFALLALLSGVDAKAAKPHSPRPKETPTDTSLYWRSRYFEKRWQKELQHDTVGSLLYPKIVEWIQQAPSPGELREFLSGLQNSTAARRLDSAQRVVWNRTMARHARAESRQDWRDAYENAGFVNSEGVFQLEVSRTNLRPGDTLLFQPRYFYGLESDMPDSLQLEISRVDLDSMGNGVSATPVDTVLAKPDGTRRGMWRLAKRLPGSGIWRISQLGDQTFHEQFVQVSWLDVAASRDASRLLVWGTSLKGAVPPPYTVRIRLSDGKWRTESTDSNGVLDVAVDTTSPYRNGSFSIVLESQGNLAFLQTGYLNTRNEDAETMTWIWTDRPSFRPGDMVHFHAMSARFTGPGSFRIEKADSLNLQIVNAEGKEVRSAWVHPDRNGQFQDSLRLPQDARQGIWFVRPSHLHAYQGIITSPNSTRFLVKAYRKPEFQLEAHPVEDVVSPGDTARIKVEGAYLFGTPLVGGRVQVRWFRMENREYRWYGNSEGQLWKTDSVTLDDHGQAIASVPAELSAEGGMLRAEFVATDASRREERCEAMVQVWPKDLSIDIQPDQNVGKVGRSIAVDVRIRDRHLKPVTGSVKFRIHTASEIVVDTTLQADSTGACLLRFTPSSEGLHTLQVAARSAKGKWNLEEFRMQVGTTGSENDRGGELSLDRSEASPGDTVQLTIRKYTPSDRHLVLARGIRIDHWEILRTPDSGVVHVRIPLTDKMGPNGTVSVMRETENGLLESRIALPVIDSSSLLRVKIQARHDLHPGDTLVAVLSIRDRSNRPVQASFTVSLADDGLWQVATKAGLWTSYGSELDLNHTPYELGWAGTTFDWGRFTPANFVHLGISSPIVALPSEFEALPKSRPIAKIPKTKGARFGIGASAGGTGMRTRSHIAPPSPRKSSRSVGDRMASMGKLEDRIDGYLDSPQAAYILSDDKEMAAPMVAASEASGQRPPTPPLAQPSRIRGDFKDLAFWSDRISTDAQGNATVRIPLPDDLTRWRLVLRGNDGVSHILEARDFFTTRSDLMVKIEAPRTLVETDSFLVGTVVHNLGSKAQDVQVELKLEGEAGKLVGPATRTVTIAAGSTSALEWPIQTLAPGKLSFKVVARTPEEADAEARSWPVQIHGIPQSDNTAGRMVVDGKDAAHANRTVAVPFSDSTRADSRVVRIETSPTIAHLLFGSLDYLTGFPYGCVEQTLSRFVPNLIVSAVTRRIGMPNDSVEAHIVEWDSAGIERLAKYQHSDGGWGWWENDATDPRMTALAVEGLLRAHTEIAARRDDGTRGQILSIEAMLRKGVPALKTTLKGERLEPALRAQVLRTLSLAPSYLGNFPLPEEIAKAWKARADLDPSGMAMLLEAAHEANPGAMESELVDLLRGVVRNDEGETHWSSAPGWGWYHDDVEATALVVRALARTGHAPALVQSTIPWLASHRTNGYWNSTKTTAKVVEALALAIETSGELDPKERIRILLDGQELSRSDVDAKSLAKGNTVLEIPGSRLKPSSKVEIQLDGRGRLYWNVTRLWTTKESPIQARSSELSVERTYTRLVYFKLNDGTSEVRREPFRGELSPGDEVEVTLTLTAKKAGEHLMLEDWFPQGMEILEKPEPWYQNWCGGWWWGYTHKEARDDRMVFFLNEVNTGTTTFSYLLRAERPGLYHALPAHAELMYDPKVKANSAETIVRIKAK